MKFFPFLLFALSFCVEASSKYFEIRDIEVKQSGKNSLIAKQKALSQAMLSAFRKVVKNNCGKEISVADSISAQAIKNCIYDYSIDQEKSSDSVYIGKFSYRFLKKKVAALLLKHGIKIDFEDEERNVVKLAVYLEDFLQHTKELYNLKIDVENFSDERVVFCINKNSLKDFRRLRIKYAQLL
ncbi:MAG: hypothetical protein LBJ96_06330 [Holosporaceae bacterium]|jgi:hypothetical protein|nr:hypothetical protein [Holosporaceae bacterium]